MSGSRPPHLVPVPPPAEAPAPEAPPTPERTGRGARGPWIVAGLLALALAVCAGFLVQQVDVRRGLEAQVEALTSSLAGAEAEIQARRSHLNAVREEVVRVQSGLSALADLVARDPVPAAAPEPAPASPELLPPASPAAD